MVTQTSGAPQPLFGPLNSIVLLLTPDHGPVFLHKFMHEHGFIRCEEIEPSDMAIAMHARSYRLFRA